MWDTPEFSHVLHGVGDRVLGERVKVHSACQKCQNVKSVAGPGVRRWVLKGPVNRAGNSVKYHGQGRRETSKYASIPHRRAVGWGQRKALALAQALHTCRAWIE